ncbi:MAG: tetratricopeptide repeat protein [Candidatus Riflebacteria bacterium]|nr:tetratricopeptide repeat protein [Candidatus Riflebacteria bacterium]
MSPTIDELLNEGNEAFSKANFHQALNHYLRALEMDPRHQVALIKTGSAYYKLRDFPNAVKHLAQALETDPQNRDLLSMIGMVYVRSGDKPNALAIYDRLKKVHPDKAEQLYKEIYK